MKTARGPARRLTSYMSTAVAVCVVVGALLSTGAAAGTSRKKKTGVARVASAAASGEVKISGWATFSGQHMGSNEDKKDDAVPQVLAEQEGAESIGSDFIYRPENEDFFWRFEVTKIPTVGAGLGGFSTAGSLNVLYFLSLAINNVDYQIRVHRVGSTDPDNLTGNAFGLFKCDEASGPACLQVASLKGGYGTTGERIVVALPLSVLRADGNNVKEGDMVGGLKAYSTVGQFLTGPVGDPYDEVRLIKVATVPIPEKSVTVTVGGKSVKANLRDGYFDASFPSSMFRNSPTTVNTKTCLGTECVTQTFKVKT